MKKTIITLLIAAGYLWLACELGGCMTPQKATSYLKKHNLLADTCAANFPVKDSLIVRDTTYYDTVSTIPEQYLELSKEDLKDSVGRTGIQVATKFLPGKIIYITKTHVHDSIHYVRDTQEEAILKKQIDNLQKNNYAAAQGIQTRDAKIDTLTETLSKQRKQKFHLWLIIAALLAWIFRKPLLSLLQYLTGPIGKLLGLLKNLF